MDAEREEILLVNWYLTGICSYLKQERDYVEGKGILF